MGLLGEELSFKRVRGADLGVVKSGGRTCAAPRLRQSLAALGSGYGLNDRRAVVLNCSEARKNRQLGAAERLGTIALRSGEPDDATGG